MRGPHGPAEEVPQDLLFGPHRVPGLIAGEDGAYLHTPPLVAPGVSHPGLSCSHGF